MKRRTIRMLTAMLVLSGGIAVEGFGDNSTKGDAVTTPIKNLPIAGEVFSVKGCTAFLILPGQGAARNEIPWVWYAPTLPNLPGAEEEWMFRKFLDAGIAVAGIDVGESCGSPAGRALFTALYEEIAQRRGLSKTPCLLARSRGGLMLYNWAAENPSAVACIAGIYPVCNLASYPGIERACAAYGMTAEQLATRLAEHNPIDRLAPLAKASVPIYHIHGDSDTVVPLENNSGELAQRYRQLGGAMTLQVVKGQGHNMWTGWFQSQELVDFVIVHAHKSKPGKADPLTTLFVTGSGLWAKETQAMKNGKPERNATDQRIVIDGVPFPQGMNSVLACLTAALKTRGEDLTYEHLMGVSSRAFQLQFNWCPSAPHAHCGFNTFEPALRATGYAAKAYPLSVWEAETRKQRKVTAEELAVARNAVRASIGAGMPVLFNSEECGVLVGCEPVGENNPTGWLHRPGPLGPPPPENSPYAHPIKELPWDVCVLRRSAEPPPDRRKSVLWSLGMAVQYARTAEYKGYAMGFAAWERWIRELGDIRPIIGNTRDVLAKFDTDESAPFAIQLGNAWCYDSLIDARRCASRYLRSEARLFGEGAAEHLRASAAAYDNVVFALTQGVACSTLIAPYPWMKDEQWTNDKRRQQAARLRTALQHERLAIEEIEKALKAEDAAEPPTE